jgi:hypothetical protein
MSSDGPFSRVRSSFDYWRKTLFGSCVIIKADPSRSSRRKPNVNNNENRNPAGVPCKKAPASYSQASQKNRKPSDLCVADSFDDQKLDMLTHIPHGMERNEWLATHTLALFEHVNALCGTVSELCTRETCPVMSYPGTSKAYWTDEVGKRHQYSAQQYIDCVMTFCERSRKNESLFPTKYGYGFEPNFEVHCRRMIRLLWHCCGHLYTKHWDDLATLNLRPQCSLVLAHITRIAKMFALLDSKELAILNNTVHLVRPPYLQEPPAKRGGGTVVNYDVAEGNFSRWRVPASKSGSWGGHPTPTIFSCKPYSQTC